MVYNKYVIRNYVNSDTSETSRSELITQTSFLKLSSHKNFELTRGSVTDNINVSDMYCIIVEISK